MFLIMERSNSFGREEMALKRETTPREDFDTHLVFLHPRYWLTSLVSLFMPILLFTIWSGSFYPTVAVCNSVIFLQKFEDWRSRSALHIASAKYGFKPRSKCLNSLKKEPVTSRKPSVSPRSRRSKGP